MKIALIGPGYGHNILPYLIYLDENKKNNSVDFFYHHKNSYSKEYLNIKFISLPIGLIKLFKDIKKYDIIWLMGGGRLLYIISCLKFFMKKKTKLIISPYSEALPRKSNEDSIIGKITLKALSNFSNIHCGWYGLSDLLNIKLKKKVLIHVMGLNKDFFRISTEPDCEILKMIDNVSENDYNFYYPKSFQKVSRHDLVIESVKMLKEKKNIPSFKVYFLGGNVICKKRYKEILSLITQYGLEDCIIILPKVKFFKTADLNYIWTKMDCGLQIAQNDGLSTTIFEPLVNKKELIISDIPPYRYLNNYFGFDFNLTPLDSTKIADEMESKILSRIPQNDHKERIIEIIKEKYSFEKNLEKLLVHLKKSC